MCHLLTLFDAPQLLPSTLPQPVLLLLDLILWFLIGFHCFLLLVLLRHGIKYLWGHGPFLLSLRQLLFPGF